MTLLPLLSHSAHLDNELIIVINESGPDLRNVGQREPDHICSHSPSHKLNWLSLISGTLTCTNLFSLITKAILLWKRLQSFFNTVSLTRAKEAFHKYKYKILFEISNVTCLMSNQDARTSTWLSSDVLWVTYPEMRGRIQNKDFRGSTQDIH